MVNAGTDPAAAAVTAPSDRATSTPVALLFLATDAARAVARAILSR